MNIQNIPTDLLHEIFARLRAKTIGRCRCVSKRLASILGSEDFKQLFLSRSLTRPRILFALAPDNNRRVIRSLPQPKNLYEKPFLVVRGGFPRLRVRYFIYTSGLFYFPDMCTSTSKSEEDTSHVICNPSTKQYLILPKPRTDTDFKSFLGFDPIDKQFKVLVMNAKANRVNNEWSGCILTLGTGIMKWRTIKCPVFNGYSYFYHQGICINGVLYYLVGSDSVGGSYMIICFDVRTETFKFKFIVSDVCGYRPFLINYKGKLGVTILRKSFNIDYHIVESVELYILVLQEDVEKKQEWSKYTLPITNLNIHTSVAVVGMTSTGEIVLLTKVSDLWITSELHHLWTTPELHYFNPEKNSLQSVEIQGLVGGYVKVVIDHVEDLHVNDAKYFKSNIHANLSDEDNDD